MKKFLSIVLCFVLLFTIFACNKNTNSVSENSENKNSANTEVSEKKGEKMVKPKVEICVADFGVMQFELDPENAPITVANFMKLVNEGFYDGLTFHRIISGFMIQGGDPLGNGTGGSSEKIKGEFADNGVDNKIEHRRGVISMARSQSYDSASSQFFICHEDSTFLDNQYAAFGKIIAGIEVVDKICEDVRVLDQNGTVNSAEQPVIEYIKEIK